MITFTRVFSKLNRLQTLKIANWNMIQFEKAHTQHYLIETCRSKKVDTFCATEFLTCTVSLTAQLLPF